MMGMDTRPGVLVVEDSPDSRREIADIILAIRDARVRYADSVQQACGVLRSEALDVVVLDLGLVGSFGRETIAQWHAMSGWHGPVVVATINQDANARLDCEAMGWAFVDKESTHYREQLESALREAMSNEDTTASTSSAKHRQALADALNRLEKNQHEMSSQLHEVAQAVEEMKKQRLGYWTHDERGREVFVPGCFTVCQQIQGVMESGKAIGSDMVGKCIVGIASALGGGVVAAGALLAKGILAR